jgi:hypothetical protein
MRAEILAGLRYILGAPRPAEAETRPEQPAVTGAAR